MTTESKRQIPPSMAAYQEFWTSAITKLPASWLHELADAGFTFERKLLADAESDGLTAVEKKKISEADFNRCKFAALRELWEVYGRCFPEEGEPRPVTGGCSSANAVKNFVACLERAAAD